MNAADLRVHVPLAQDEDNLDSEHNSLSPNRNSQHNSQGSSADSTELNSVLKNGRPHTQPLDNQRRSTKHISINTPSSTTTPNNTTTHLSTLDNNNTYTDNNQSDDRRQRHKSPGSRSTGSEVESTFSDMGGSLEDLVTTFDQKITECFKDYAEETEEIAPVQMRSDEQIMNGSQIWWTLTGNFGNIAPLDWTKTTSRERQLPLLNIDPNAISSGSTSHRDSAAGQSDESDEELARQLDMHSLVGQSPHGDSAHAQTADQVIQEIDEIMQGSMFTECSGTTDQTMESVDSLYSSMKSPFPNTGISSQANSMMASSSRDPNELEAKLREASMLTSSEDNLVSLPYSKLCALSGELESLIQAYNEALVQELALKDELEFEKELKNTFISLLLSVQNKKRMHAADKKRKTNEKADRKGEVRLPQFCTAVIPFEESSGPLNNHYLQALVRILGAVNENNPQVPSMLTDYILNVVCPSSDGSL